MSIGAVAIAQAPVAGQGGSSATTSNTAPKNRTIVANSDVVAQPDAIGFLTSVASAFVGISHGAGLRPQVQMGEPWWWVTPAGNICLYDAAAKAAFGGNPVEIANVRGSLSAASCNCWIKRARCSLPRPRRSRLQ